MKRKRRDRPVIQPPVPIPPEPSPTPSNAFNVYDGFEHGDGFIDWGRQTAISANLKTVPYPGARAGNSVLRVICDKSDKDVAGGPRSEILQPKSMGYWVEGDSVRVKGSILFPVAYVDDPAQEIIWQVHYVDPGVPFFIQSVDGNLIIKGKGFDDVTIPKTKGVWMDIKTEHKWSSQSDGYTRVWINQKAVVNYTGPTMQAGQNMYQKFGMYKTGWRKPGSNVTTRILYYDELTINLMKS